MKESNKEDNEKERLLLNTGMNEARCNYNNNNNSNNNDNDNNHTITIYIYIYIYTSALRKF